MTRDELEQKIAEASEGELTSTELTALEKELMNWPDLKQDYTAIMNLPDFERVYPVADKIQFSSQIEAIQRQIHKQNQENDKFSELSFHIFKRYALAASVLIIVGSSALYLSDDSIVSTQDTATAEELFVYQTEGTASDNYMVQIDNLLLDENSDEY